MQLPQFILDFLTVFEYGDLLAQGFVTMVSLYGVALAAGFGLGLMLSLARQFGGGISSKVATGYIEFFRGTPLLVQLFAIYFLPSSLEAMGLAIIPIDWAITVGDITLLDRRLLSCYIALSLNSAAYQAEYIRGAISSVGSGQLEAAQSIGMSKTEGIRNIVLPQAFRRVIPSWSNEAAYLPKYTVVAYFIGVEGLFAMANRIISRTFLVIPAYVTIGAIFLVVITVVSRFLDYIHDYTKIPGL